MFFINAQTLKLTAESCLSVPESVSLKQDELLLMHSLSVRNNRTTAALLFRQHRSTRSHMSSGHLGHIKHHVLSILFLPFPIIFFFSSHHDIMFHVA